MSIPASIQSVAAFAALSVALSLMGCTPGAGAGGESSSSSSTGGASGGSSGQASSGGSGSSSGASTSGGSSSSSAASGGSGSSSTSSTGASSTGASSSSSSGAVSVCGDMNCSATEACFNCEADCGACPNPPDTECNDGIDNDGDGLVDWQMDMGCWSAWDTTEASGTRAQEGGWTTFDLSPNSTVIYVSASTGDDARDGLTPQTAVATPARGAALVRDGFPDFLLFQRGDTWRGMDIGPNRVVRRFKSGQDAAHPIVVSSYGDSVERPRFEIDKPFIDDDGNQRSYLAVVGLAFVSFPKIPGDPAFNGADGGALRFVGTGHDILVEDNYVQYGEFTAQNIADITLRRNVVYRSYHVDTCAYNSDGSRNPNGSSTYRPSGIFAGHVNGLVLEQNVFDENGWNPDVPEACATIYNHDMYLSGNDRVVVKENLILRASSIGVKMAANETGASTGILIENNLFAEGEIGISMGGNADTQYRFTNAVVRDNVFTDIGRAQPTTRTLTWYIDISDNDNTEIRGNLLVNQPDLNNPYGIHLAGDSNRAITVADNLLYGLKQRSLWAQAAPAWSAVSFTANTVVSSATNACLVSHEGGFGSVSYTGNAYRSAGAGADWFCVGGTRRNLAQWSADSGETGASQATVMAPDPGRNLDAYAVQLGIGTTLADFAARARQQSRHHYRDELTAANANNFIRAGFGLAPR